MTDSDRPVVELWHVADCPLVDRVRTTLQECLEQLGMDVLLVEHERPCPSPTLVVAGIDVATGAAPINDVCCRLDLPTHDQIRAVLTRRA